MYSDIVRLVSSIRLSSGGIHLGHYVGNLLPSQDFTLPKQYIFVIKDTEPVIWEKKEKKWEVLLDMVTDILAIPFADSILLTTSSSILSNSYLLYSVIQDIVTFNRLTNIHFKKDGFRKNEASNSIKNFLYPVDEAATLLALKPNYILANDDNLRSVRFISDIAKKINRLFDVELMPMPRIYHHKYISRLIGYDYRRMCKAHNNTIRVSDEPNVLMKKITQITSRNNYFAKNQKALEAFTLDEINFVFPDDYLPFVFWRVFSSYELSQQEKAYYSKVVNKSILNQKLYDLLDKQLEPIRKKKTFLYNNQSIVLDRLEHDAFEISKIVKSNLHNIENLLEYE
jgi:tryptophanyl-tRNA synthetase